MPNQVEVNLQINIDRVSCPGVWLCQDGHVALLLFAFGTGYQTRFLPPMFPLNFKDTFYFKKQFLDLCASDNLSLLLRDETIYCELIQTNDPCGSMIKPIVLAQYLGSLGEVLFPPNVCITEGVDLLMKRTDNFPGILAPKVEISTRVRIDHSYKSSKPEVKPQHEHSMFQNGPCRCPDVRNARTVCHTPQYHRLKCARPRPLSATRFCNAENNYEYRYNNRSRSKSPAKCCPPPRLYYAPPPNSNINQYVYHVSTPAVDFRNLKNSNISEREERSTKSSKTTLESRFIPPSSPEPTLVRTRPIYKQTLCTCDICKRYYEIFEKDQLSKS